VCRGSSQYGGSFGGNVSYGYIIYNVFGCDSDADYGRLIDLYVKAVRYSGNMTWAKEMLPAAQALAAAVLERRAVPALRPSFVWPFRSKPSRFDPEYSYLVVVVVVVVVVVENRGRPFLVRVVVVENRGRPFLVRISDKQ
jgi:hypothetical protein